MKLTFITNAVFVGEDGKAHDIDAGQTVNITNEEAAKGYIERGTAVEEGTEDTISDQLRATFRPSPVDVASTNSGNVEDVSEPPVSEGTDEQDKEAVELQ